MELIAVNFARTPFSLFQKRCASVIQKMSTPSKWTVEKNRILSLPIEEKRKLYKSGDFVTLNQIDPWCNYVVRNKEIETKKHNLEDLNEFRKIKLDQEKNKLLAEKVSVYRGDITKLEIDAIVNAANSRLKAGGGVDGAIHRAAGSLLQDECNSIGGCPTGDACITGGYNLPAKYIIHTVGPQDGSAPKLLSCYEKCLSFQSQYRLKSIAFPCISTGIYGFPNRLAAHIALRTARTFLENNEELQRIIFCTFMPIDVEIYETLMQMYFPLHEWNYNDGAAVSE
ncbi:unnamed protein product [Pieris macdunnoughi]|uniref:Macro domain-containing protein n=1 Tax=Pieris macdunnoughi TaxID=345717 RepID=A0A821XWN1_9NEOP|nr:unnamed protein product [Pieris macdunnoughi]